MHTETNTHTLRIDVFIRVDAKFAQHPNVIYIIVLLQSLTEMGEHTNIYLKYTYKSSHTCRNKTCMYAFNTLLTFRIVKQTFNDTQVPLRNCLSGSFLTRCIITEK